MEALTEAGVYISGMVNPVDGMESPTEPLTDAAWNEQIRAVLCALYLPGAPLGARRSGWGRVLVTLQCHPGDPAAVLRNAGLLGEASLMADPAIKAMGLIASYSALTVLDPAYPWSWRDRLGAAAPPALPACGALPPGGAPWIAVVGSRDPNADEALLAQRYGREIALAGAVLVSGGAPGIDTLAAQAALTGGGHVVEVLPCGVDGSFGRPGSSRSLRLAVSPVGVDFSAAAAKERNHLVYAGSCAALVIAPRFRNGGTWSGAVEALRRRLTTVVVPDLNSEAYQALVSLGAKVTPSQHLIPQLLAWAQDQAPAQPSLFGIDQVREPVLAYAV